MITVCLPLDGLAMTTVVNVHCPRLLLPLSAKRCSDVSAWVGKRVQGIRCFFVCIVTSTTGALQNNVIDMFCLLSSKMDIVIEHFRRVVARISDSLPI